MREEEAAGGAAGDAASRIGIDQRIEGPWPT
jgi:hypothetical protein